MVRPSIIVKITTSPSENTMTNQSIIRCLHRPAEEGAQYPLDTDVGQEQSGNRTSEMSSGYLSLDFDNPSFIAEDVVEDNYDTIGNLPTSDEK